MTRVKSERDRKAARDALAGKPHVWAPNVEAPNDDAPQPESGQMAVIISADHLLITQNPDGLIVIHLVDDEGNGAFIPLDASDFASLGETCAAVAAEALRA